MKNNTFAIIGAGHGGKAMAAHLAIMGFNVNLYNHKEIEDEYLINLPLLRKIGGIYCEGVVEGFGKLNIITSDIAVAVEEADIIMVVVPAHVHKYIARILAPYIRDEHIIILNPGRTFGAIEFKNIIRRYGGEADFKIAETETLIYTSRAVSPDRVKIYSIKRNVKIAALPSVDTEYVVSNIKGVYPQMFPVKNVLETSFSNVGAVLHPTITLLNVGWIESKSGFRFYIDGASKAVCKYLERVDMERVNIAKKFGVNVLSLSDWLKSQYNSSGRSLYQLINNTIPYHGIKAPTSIMVRYLLEDVPTGLVPYASLADHINLKAKAMKTLIDLASMLLDIDFWHEGRTIKNLGLSSMGIDDIINYVMYGEAS